VPRIRPWPRDLIPVTQFLKWLDAASVVKLGRAYLIVSALVLVSGVLLFFPILLVYSILGREFSNLGPMATFLWAVLFEVVVVTPLFVVLLVVKIVRRGHK